MKEKKTLLLLILALALLLGGASVLYTRLGANFTPDQLAVQEQPPQQTESPTTVEPPSEESVPAKIQAPDFTVYDKDGSEVHLSDFFGKPIVVNFWASWCGPCKMEMPDFHETYLELGDEIQFLMINMTDGSRETVDIAADFIAEQGYTFPVFYDTALSAAITYGAYSLPTTYFIDADGYAIAQATGAISTDILMQGINMIR